MRNGRSLNIYTARNQYKVVLEIDPKLQIDPSLLDRIYVGDAGGGRIPLSSVAHFERGTAPLSVRHQGQFPAATLSFNLPEGMALGDAEKLVEKAALDLRMPEDVHTAVRRQRAMDAEIAGDPAAADRRRADLDLHRAGRAVREPAAPADDHFHAALGGHRRAAGACW